MTKRTNTYTCHPFRNHDGGEGTVTIEAMVANGYEGAGEGHLLQVGAFVKDTLLKLGKPVVERDRGEAAVGESPFVKKGERGGKSDALQTGTFFEGGVYDGQEPLVERHRLELCAGVERPLADGIDIGGDDHGNQRRVESETEFVDEGKRGREAHRLQIDAVLEGMIAC